MDIYRVSISLEKEQWVIESKEKKVTVTGGAMWIGLETCRRLIKEGYDVTICDLSQKDLNAAAKELKEAGGGERISPIYAMFPTKP